MDKILETDIKTPSLPSAGAALDGDFLRDLLKAFHERFEESSPDGILAWNAAASALELALTECWLKEHETGFDAVMPPRKRIISYSGIISSGAIQSVGKMAERLRDNGIRQIKMKVENARDAEKVALVRKIFGKDASLRLDANGAFSKDNAIDFIRSVEEYSIDAIEQPVPRGEAGELAQIKSQSPVPVMADESLITMDDAINLVSGNACDLFNLRITKCGGILPVLQMAEMARHADIGVQLGCLVGETAILSAAGRFLAAHCTDFRFIEGSYGPHLLSDDISKEAVGFGFGGEARPLSGPGFAIRVSEEKLIRYATQKEILGERQNDEPIS
ncbi:MAG: enolase [Oligoflexales bacterium]|nr:enolase [Oligoflexales bacterium]